MRPLEVWVERGSSSTGLSNVYEHDDDDLVPSELVLQCFAERIRDDERDVLPHLASCFTKMVTENGAQNTKLSKRARAALRLVLAIAVHCLRVEYQELREIQETLYVNQKVFSSEIRYLENGGLTSFAGVFPLSKSPTEANRLLKMNWRKSCQCLTRISTSNESAIALTSDVITRIMQFCDARTLLRAASVSTEWRNAERLASEQLWTSLLISQWPDMASVNVVGAKTRYKNRYIAIRSRKVPLGRRQLPPVIFCTVCDRIFSTSFHLAQHKCEKQGQKVSSKQPPKKQLKQDTNRARRTDRDHNQDNM